MTRFTYKAMPKAGGAASTMVVGRLEASDEGALRERLRRDGLIPVEVRPVSFMDSLRGSLVGSGLRRSDSEWFFQTLRWLLEGKVPIESAIATMEEIAPRPPLAAAAVEVREGLRSGESLAVAVEKITGLADRQTLALLRVGHESGRLEHTINLIDRSLTTRQRIRKTVTGRLIYPAVLLAVALVAIWVISTIVLPRFEETLASTGVQLPASTRATIAVAGVLKWVIPPLLVVIAGMILTKRFHLPGPLRASIDRLMLQTPVVGHLRWHGQGAIVADTLATMLEGGGDVLAGLEQAEAAVSSGELRKRVAQTRASVREGEELGEALARERVFPPMVSAVVRAGLASGELVASLRRAADRSVDRQEDLTSRLLTLMEPAIIIVLGGVIGWVILSLIAGMMTINDVGGLG